MPRKRVTKKTAAKMAAAKEEPPVPLTSQLLGSYWYEPIWLYRFLFEDGTVWDVHAIHADSRLSEALLKSRGIKNDRIIGAARVACVGYANMQSPVTKLA